MLRYLNQGLRPFGDYPMPVHKRLNWDFYAVVEGTLAPSFESSEPAAFCRDTLWVFPPGCAHGWVGEAGQPCHIIVFHFAGVPAALDRRVRDAGHLAVPLSSADKAVLGRVQADLQGHYWRPGTLSELHFERALMELSLLLLEKPTEENAHCLTGCLNAATGSEPPARAAALARVLAAENWFRQHLPAQPSLTDVARASGLSPGHLRRLFHAVRHLSPKEALTRIRMEQAMQLLAHSDRKLADVAAECGFSGASQFCQTFRHRHGTTPTFWRRHAYTPYQDPAVSRCGPREVLVQFGLLPEGADRASAG
jgi:AraC-like DNA-binding protein